MVNMQEKTIRAYFNAWLTKDSALLDKLFAKDAVYTESYGPEYHGMGQIKQWFADWNKKGSVKRWDIRQFVHQGNTVAVEWYFECEYDGVTTGFDGVTLVRFDGDGCIESIKEFQSKAEHDYPYE